MTDCPQLPGPGAAGGRGGAGGRGALWRGVQGTVRDDTVAWLPAVLSQQQGKLKHQNLSFNATSPQKCSYHIEVADNHTVKLTCDSFILQGGQNCSHDYMMVDYTGDR